MQPTSLPRSALGRLAVSSSAPPPDSTALVERIEVRPQSALANGSYAWPAWAVLGVAVIAIVGGFGWWLKIQRGKRAAPSLSGVTEPAPSQISRF
jgi:hypothetical protein